MSVREIIFCDFCNDAIKSFGAMMVGEGRLISCTGFKSLDGVDLYEGCYDKLKPLLDKLGICEFENRFVEKEL